MLVVRAAGGKGDGTMGEGLPKLSFDEVIDRLLRLQEPHQANYLAMYSSWYGGVVTDPALMMVPIDDHLVHRGDGVFEAIKCVGGMVYGLERHLERMEGSARAVALTIPATRNELRAKVLGTLAAAGATDAVVRVFVSRGPGGFSTNPYECPASQLYIMVTRLEVPPRERYERGVTLRSSRIPIKMAYFAGIKSCNYLPNVLMRKEAEDAGVDYTVSIDEQGCLGEGPTENVGIVTRAGEFLVPCFDRVLRGITVTRVGELAAELVADGTLSSVGEARITREEAYQAAEVMMFGTTFDVLPVVNYDGRIIGDGAPGPVYRRFLELLRRDLTTNVAMATPVVRG
jgi:branched-chain amino acid aminotransferase